MRVWVVGIALGAVAKESHRLRDPGAPAAISGPALSNVVPTGVELASASESLAETTLDAASDGNETTTTPAPEISPTLNWQRQLWAIPLMILFFWAQATVG